jgi:hypothetical protein
MRINLLEISMSNLVKQSLEDNEQEILENLPGEFHNDFKASIETAAPTARLNNEEAKDLASLLMQEDPSIDDKECVPLLDSDNLINQVIQQPNDAELELQKEQLLAEIEVSLETE